MSATVLDAWNLYKELVLENLSKKEQTTETGRWVHHMKDMASIPLSEIRTLHIAKLKKSLEKKNLMPQTVYHVLSLLRTILRHALEMELYEGKLPTFKMPKFDNKRQRFLTQREASILLAILKEHTPLWYDIALFALQTGMRASEIFELKKSHVSFENASITIFEPKNNTTRHVPINTISHEILSKRLPRDPDGLFFTQESGKPIKQAGRLFKRCVDLAGFNKGIADKRNHIVFHTLRHTFASWLIQRGTPLEVVGELLGHKTLAMTKRYAHLAPTQRVQAVNQLPDLFSTQAWKGKQAGMAPVCLPLSQTSITPVTTFSFLFQ